METPRFTTCVSRVIVSEGGSTVTHTPGDAGGWTKYGITLATLSASRKLHCSPVDIQNLTRAEAESIYLANYWSLVHGDDLPTGVDYAVFDSAVNCGVSRAVRWLQTAINTTPDGVIGPATLAAVCTPQASETVRKIADLRTAYYQDLAKANPQDTKFLVGWLSRVGHVTALSLQDAA